MKTKNKCSFTKKERRDILKKVLKKLQTSNFFMCNKIQGFKEFISKVPEQYCELSKHFPELHKVRPCYTINGVRFKTKDGEAWYDNHSEETRLLRIKKVKEALKLLR